MSHDFSPFGSEKDLPGEPSQIKLLGQRYVDTADEIRDAASQLRAMGSSMTGTWKGLAGKKFPEKAHDLAGRIAKAEARYRRTGNALVTFANQAESAQAAAATAAHHGRTAKAHLDASAPVAGPPSHEPTPEETAAATARAHAHTQAGKDLASAERAFHDAKSDYDKAARNAHHEITEASDDKLHDSWWYKHWHTLVRALEIIAVIVLVIAVVCLVLACPAALGLVGLLFGEGAALTAGAVFGAAAVVADWVGFGLAATILALHVDGKLEGHDVTGGTLALDVLAVVTFGMGKALGRVIGGMAKGAETTAKAEVATEAMARSFAEYEELLGRAPTLLDYVMVDALRPVAIERALEEGGRAVEALETTLKASENAAPAVLRLLCRENPAEIMKLARLAELDPRFAVTLEQALRISLNQGIRQTAVDVEVTDGLRKEIHEEAETERRVEEIAEELRRHLLSTP